MHGILNIYKPAGKSSRDAVNDVQRLTQMKRVGHAGTLDPIATGVLVVCTGWATRLIQYIQHAPKKYVGTFRLGCRSASDDIESELQLLENPATPDRAQIQRACAAFTGEIQQRPPIFSAVKVNGRRAYKLARKGRPVDLEPRPVQIFKLDVVQYEYPHVTLDVECGSGTYIRSLGRDLAEHLGTAAVMTALERTAVGSFDIDTAVDLQQETEQSIVDHVLPPIAALDQFQRIDISDDDSIEFRHGRKINAPVTAASGITYVTIDPSGHLVALAQSDGKTLAPKSVFPADE